MTQSLFVKPAEGRRVRKEDGTLLAEDGEAVDVTRAYWRRRLDDGDIQDAVQPPPAQTKPGKAEGADR